MIQVFQAEWCPHSSRLRQRLTELGVDYVIRQTGPTPDQRHELTEATGCTSIPTVVLDDGTVLGGETDDIIAELERQIGEGRGAEWEQGHQDQASAHA
jgi:glutaredoxin